jgi:hypothetical protein
MRPLGICAAMLVVAGCGASANSSAPRVASSITPAAATAVTASQSPSPGAALACRLPVVITRQTAQGWTQSGSFITFPAGQLTSDPGGGFVQEGSRIRSTVQPYLFGAGEVSYDWALGRWLPASLRSTSPDGSHYAYRVDWGAIHDVEVTTATDRTLKAVPNAPDTVMYYAKEGIYFNHAWEAPGPGPGLWLLDPSSGIVHTVFTDKSVETVGGFAAWLDDVNPADPHPVFSQMGGSNLPNQVLRRDLNGGRTVTWFYRPGHTVAVIGFDQNKQPLILSDSDGQTEEIWQVPAANAGHKLYSGTRIPRPMADSHGIWFSDDQGISLYTPSMGLQKMSAIVAQLAGACR